MKNMAVVVMGCGGVGRQLLHHIVSCRSLHAQQKLHLRVVGVCDSKSLIVASDVFTMELDDTFLVEVCRVKSTGSSLLTLSNSGQHKVFSNPEAMRKIIDIATLLGRSTGLAFVDCSASSETIGVLKKVVDLSCCVVMANKKPLTSSMEDYEKLLAYPRRVRHESTVGAGLPVIVSLNRILLSGDPIHRIVGSLSGTLGYVMSEVEDGKPFSQVVKSAKSLGYTEPDPRDDLSGMDVARKALIIARLLGRRIDLDSIKVESLFPVEMGPNMMPVEAFLENGLPLLDKGVQERVEKASSNGNVLRYVCLIEESRYEVGIQELPKNSPLGRLRGSDNVLEISSRCYNQQPLVIQGAGAGNDTTAAGVLADILDIQDLFP
ncbi:Homoserine dehydrogenase [Actinidia chinensis var. chinensis]|uniref:Homoserine dehydrogenase n=1 Tax=Actinidia chinensis var. chinensis TaxID=1590841 RepID=A0A2R6PFC7_ACTCC|nr:Homoserine dehydrogenase [Actinidia chinensis var. chinensis]